MYPYEDLAGDPDESQEAGDPDGVAGACPPRIRQYRIYPEVDFNAVFGNPPANVIT